jgi:hypothetical protein
LPNIDSTSWEPLLSLCEAFPDHCFPWPDCILLR